MVSFKRKIKLAILSCSRTLSIQLLYISVTIFVIAMVALTALQINHYSPFTSRSIEPKQNLMHLPKRKQGTEISYTSDSLPKWDFTRLINMDSFSFLLENTICDETKPLDLLIGVTTAPGNLARRNTIRETWGQPMKNIRLVFFLGGVKNQTLQDSLDAEDRKYHDLVQGNFVDTYKNLTYKYIMTFKYVVYYCPTVKYILKTDDDLFVNTPVVMDYIHTLPPEGKKNFVLCNAVDDSPVFREPSPWYVSFSEYPHSFYPIYCSGFAVLYSYDVTFRLYREGQRGEYFWVDDAFVTGILGKRINIKHTSLPLEYIMLDEEMETFIASGGKEGPQYFWYGPINLNHKKVQEMWTILVNKKVNTSTTSPALINYHE